MAATSNCRYDSAEVLLKSLKKIDPSLPLSELFLASNYIAKNLDFSLYDSNEIIDSLLDEAEKLSGDLLENDSKNVWYIYFYALSKSYRAYFKSLTRDYLIAFADGITAVKYFEKCLLIDKNFFEAKMAIGNFLYWKSKIAEPINFLPFIKDEKQQGIKFIEETIENASYNQNISVYSLIWIYIREQRFEDAIELAQNWLKLNPDARFIKLALASAFIRVDKTKALSLYEDILASYKKEKYFNKVVEITIKHKAAVLQYDLANYEEALLTCVEILAIDGLSISENNPVANRINRVKELKKKIEDTLNSR